MTNHTLEHQREFDYETTDERMRRARAELLRRAGVRPAPGSMFRNDRVTVKPYPRWVLALAKRIF